WGPSEAAYLSSYLSWPCPSSTGLAATSGAEVPDEGVQPLGSVRLEAGEDLGVDLGRCRQLRVPQHLLDDPDVHAAGEQERRRGVPDVVQPDVASDASLPAGVLPEPEQVARVLDRADLRGEDQSVVDPDLALERGLRDERLLSP